MSKYAVIKACYSRNFASNLLYRKGSKEKFYTFVSKRQKDYSINRKDYREPESKEIEHGRNGSASATLLLHVYTYTNTVFAVLY